jgi:hypothetical protein
VQAVAANAGATVAPNGPGPPPGRPFRFFSAKSFWNRPLPADAPVDPHSAEIGAAFNREIAAEKTAGGGPTVNTTRWSVPIYTVPADQPAVSVDLASVSPQPALQLAFEAVPLPPNAQPAGGNDRHLAVWQPSTDRLWEFWQLAHGPQGWYASAGGAMRNVSSGLGVYERGVWPGATSTWGGWASSLALVGGLISLEDLELGRINHALVISIPNVRAYVYASPARRTDGTSADPLSLPEGAHLRLPPGLNLAALHLPRLALMIAEAAQQYGLFVAAKAANVAFSAQDPVSNGTEPFGGPDGFFEGTTPQQLLASFPWKRLQLLKMTLYRAHGRHGNSER